MKIFNKIAIIGVGLIGGSLGLAVRKKRIAGEVIGIARRESSRKKALKFKAVGSATLDFKKAIKDADLVVLAVPVGKIIGLAKQAVRGMKKGAILTDVGSSKENIVRKAEKIAGKKVHFIGSHPMAGSDKKSVENASSSIFTNAPLILTKTKNTDKKSLNRLIKFWQSLGCRVFVISPEKHDKFVSLSSYLPHVISYTLSFSQTKDSVKFAGGSLKDTTRVASSDTDLWKDIFLLSRKRVLNSIRVFSENLRLLERAIIKKDQNSIKKFLKKAKGIRDNIN